MNICIKYCGGCNPRYDRNKIISYLKHDFQSIDIVTQLDNSRCDFVVVINGCASSCASHKGLEGKHGKFVVTDLTDYEELKSILKQIIKD